MDIEDYKDDNEDDRKPSAIPLKGKNVFKGWGSGAEEKTNEGKEDDSDANEIKEDKEDMEDNRKMASILRKRKTKFMGLFAPRANLVGRPTYEEHATKSATGKITHVDTTPVKSDKVIVCSI